jgi:hypothetical protein
VINLGVGVAIAFLLATPAITLGQDREALATNPRLSSRRELDVS